MSADRWQRVKDVFQAALDVQPEARSVFLAHACRDDADMRGEVESLLASHGEAASFLSSPALPRTSSPNVPAAPAMLSPGQRLGRYEVLSFLGSGGMGEVYRALDTSLGREVAVKALPFAFAADSDRLARFDREARILAALNHPNIAALYGVEALGEGRVLVMELVPGKTLAERLREGALPLDEALPVFRQMAEGLEAAHEQGIVHRDLKPSNVKITPDGKVKLLDFGIAKASTAISGSMEDPARTETMATGTGVVLGTVPYMSPEQARGKPVDRRTDVWSFGCVLYEALAGRRPFDGETVTDVLAMIVGSDPDWAALPDKTPPRLRELLRRCLHKDPQRRLRDIGDARLDLEEAEAGRGAVGSDGTPAFPRRSRWAVVVAAGIAAAGWAVAGLAVWSGPGKKTVTQGVTRFSVGLPALTFVTDGNLPSVALSPDGRRLVYVTGKSHRRQLFVREMASLEATAIPGTAGAEGPFFSPDGRWLGFFVSGKLRKVGLTGGTPVDVCDAPEPRGASWAADGAIVAALGPKGGLVRIDADGRSRPVTHLGTDPGKSHRWPEVLPGGKAVLFTEWSDAGFEDSRIVVHSLTMGPRRHLVEGGSFPRYIPSGHLAYVRSNTLYVAPFDLGRLELTGPPVPALDSVAVNATTGAAHFAVSADGAAAYVPFDTSVDERRLVWWDRKAGLLPVLSGGRPYIRPRVSPEGGRIALMGPDRHLWVYEIGGSLRRVTSGSAWYTTPVWSPDGRSLTFTSDRGGRPNLFRQSIEAEGREERLTTSEHRQFPGSWTPDGNTLVFWEEEPETGWDIRSLTPGKPSQSVLATPADELNATLSPDGRWLAYDSNESGTFEVYVQPFPGTRVKWQVSSGGGRYPVWARDGQELFFCSARPGKVMAVAISKDKVSLAPQEPKALLDAPYADSYDVGPDRRLVLVVGKAPNPILREVIVVQGWVEELKRMTAPHPP